MYLNKYKKIKDGFSLVEVIIGIMLSSGILISLTFLMSDIFNQLSYEDVNQKVQSYGNYVLDDISESFRVDNLEEVSIGSFDGNSIIRIFHTDEYDNTEETKYSVDSGLGIINKNNNPIHNENKDYIDSYRFKYLNDLENKNYRIVVSDFSCLELESISGSSFGGSPLGANSPGADRYGPRSDGGKFKDALYVVGFQMQIYKQINDDLELFNVVSFQRTVFVHNEFINEII